MHTFKLTGQRGETFLAQDRKDPITGDAFAAGDEVVFCAHCRSAFHVSSWEYLGGKHCEQEKTLDAFPVQKKLKLVQKTGAQLYPRPLTLGEVEEKKRERLKLYYAAARILLIPLGILLFVKGSGFLAFIGLITFLVGLITGLFYLLFLYFIDGLLALITFLQSSGEELHIYEHVISLKPFLRRQKVYRILELEKLEVFVKANGSTLAGCAGKADLYFHLRKGSKKRVRLSLSLGGELKKLLEGVILLSFHLPTHVTLDHRYILDDLEELRDAHQAPLELSEQ